jgi:hypothetical protein
MYALMIEGQHVFTGSFNACRRKQKAIREGQIEYSKVLIVMSSEVERFAYSEGVS